jgi:FkbM family methyltransferase
VPILVSFVEKVWKLTELRKLENNLKKMSAILQLLSRSLQMIWKKFGPIHGDYQKSLYGVYLKSRFPDKTFSYCLFGNYGFFLAGEIEKIEDPTVFIDIGANIGLYSLLAAKNKNIKRILSFEPDPSSYAYLKQNVEFSESDCIDTFSFAISKVAGNSYLKVVKNHSGISTLTSIADETESYETIRTVNWEFLDKEIAYEVDTSFFVKIDVEGHEQSVLECLLEWKLFEQIRTIFMEFVPAVSDVIAIEQLLVDHGFIERKRVGNRDHWDGLWVKT